MGIFGAIVWIFVIASYEGVEAMMQLDVWIVIATVNPSGAWAAQDSINSKGEWNHERFTP